MKAKVVIGKQSMKAVVGPSICCPGPNPEVGQAHIAESQTLSSKEQPGEPDLSPEQAAGGLDGVLERIRANRWFETACLAQWQLAAAIFHPPELERLVPRQRRGRLETESPDGSVVDPIAFTEAVAYEFLSRGGKQARPFITLATYSALAAGVEADRMNEPEIPDHVKRVALSIEIFHKASLVHDDIEDEDDYRYGQPTLHRKYGIASAINVGDYLIGLGYRLVSRDAPLHGAEIAARLLDILAAAHQRLCEGQGAELCWRDALNKKLLPSDALKIYALKTSPAFEAALLCGAALRGALEEYAEPFRCFARHVGVAFQILNDLKDWSRDESNKKVIGGDLIGGRPTALWALALERLPPGEQAELLDLAQNRQLCDSARTARARELYLQANVFHLARELVLEQRAAALDVADELPEGAMRLLLNYIVDAVLNRPHAFQFDTVAGQCQAQAGTAVAAVHAPESVG